MKKIIPLIGISAILLFGTINPSEVQAEETLNGWHLVGEGPKYFENGEFLTGLQTIGKTTYLFDANGLKQTGWHKVKGKDYYFDLNLNGGMVTGKRKIGNTTYLLHNDGYKVYGWHKLGGKDYYFDPNYGGGMVTGKRKIGNTTYLMHNDGHKTYGWHQLAGKDHYFDPNYGGGMVTGKRKIGNTTYLLHNNGYKIYGWSRLNGKDYYFDPNYGGGMVTGERRVENSVYLFNSDGSKNKYLKPTEQVIRDGIDTADIPYLNLTDAEIYVRAKDPNNANYEYREAILPSNPTDPLKGEMREALTERDVEAVNHGDAINELTLNQELLKLINAERARLGIKALMLDKTLAIGADQRALELAESGTIRPFDPRTGKPATDNKGNALTHHRPYNPKTGTFDPFYTAFNYRNDEPLYSVGENLAARTYSGNPYELNSERLLAETFYTQWKNSSGHYQNMIADGYTGTWVSIKVEQTARYMGDYMNMYDVVIGAQFFAVDSEDFQ